jgi:hypothetical protein
MLKGCRRKGQTDWKRSKALLAIRPRADVLSGHNLSRRVEPKIHHGSANVFKTSRHNHKISHARQSPSPSQDSNKASQLEVFHDTRTGVLPGIPGSARCVQRFDDSLNSAIHITYRNSLRSSSMREPRDPLLKVV